MEASKFSAMCFKPQLNRASFVRNAKDSVSIELSIFRFLLRVCVCVFGFCLFGVVWGEALTP